MLQLSSGALFSLLIAGVSAVVGYSAEVENTYVSLTTTCQNANPVSGSINVTSLQDCFAHCDDVDNCNSVDTDGSQCYLKSHCEGNRGACSGWCGYVRNGTAPSPPPPPPYPPKPPVNTTLRDAANKRGIFVGSAINAGHLQQNDSDGDKYRSIAAQQYSLATAENACKWPSTEPEKGKFDFTSCNVVADFAREHDITFRGHNLCWGNYNPDWLTHGNFTSEEMRSILVNHTTTVSSYYGTRAYGWDVVNEAVSDNPGAGGSIFKPTVWFPKVPDYVDLAFNATNAAVGKEGVKLFYNDYNIASMDADAVELHPVTGEPLRMGSQKKSDAVYDMIKSMRARGIPVHGVGLQCHIPVDFSSFSGVKANIARYAALGVEVHITELDISCKGSCSLQEQAVTYAGMLEACLSSPACKNFETWGFTDKYAWESHQLPYDSNFHTKPAYTALLEGLLGH
eukprot:m.109180 g.109180  ORF g.109180 m.109180 type:complete len:454 (-) comp16962_c0_seq1:150-1511(-)